ncbi:NAD(P)-binding protein [Canariomyces notabilis]|uniref:NAD(P)-binding protein n=1 Tax=Canariomyces notabilis TaxID=2074819 RepID=A0AAN6TAV6_9PEZI|nr:NAD(P)-binding protein [Canariomyces arenarius]
MSDNTVYLITGANRGIGFKLVTLLLARPHTIVIATSRSPTFPPLAADATVHPTSKLIPFHLDVVVANAGSSTGFKDVLHTEPDEMLRDFEVNTLGPVRLFRAVAGLMQLQEEGAKKEKKFVLITSSIGSIGIMDLEKMLLPGVGYGMSKAAANWWAKRISLEFKDKGLLVGVLHPGWVKTAMGQALADALGLKEAAITEDESAKGVLEQIDNLTTEKSGQFLTYNGMQLPW